MIRLASEKDRKTVTKLCQENIWDGTTALNAFDSKCRDRAGADREYCSIWLGGEQGESYLICKTGQTCRLIGSPEEKDRDELCGFLQMQGGKLSGSSRLIWDCSRYMKKTLPETAAVCCPRMILRGECPAEESPQVQQSQSLWKIYEVLSDGGKNKRFISHISQDEFTARLRFVQRGGAQFFEVRREENPVSVGTLLLPEHSDYALIINLCTKSKYRKKGYAAQIVRHMCRVAEQQGRTPILDCGSKSLEQYYRRFGFCTEDYWQSIQLG